MICVFSFFFISIALYYLLFEIAIFLALFSKIDRIVSGLESSVNLLVVVKFINDSDINFSQVELRAIQI
tara:strand:- start:243 stop:449 length:207 start_codon:yes stop_codon:yes gene_type:complete